MKRLSFLSFGSRRRGVVKRFMVALSIATLAACGGDGGGTGPSPIPPPVLAISGFVSQFEVVPTASGRFADINYEVTITSNIATTGCFIRVNWLNVNALQIGFTFASTNATVPAGTSKITNQDFEDIATALSIKDARVEFSLCS